MFESSSNVRRIAPYVRESRNCSGADADISGNSVSERPSSESRILEQPELCVESKFDQNQTNTIDVALRKPPTEQQGICLVLFYYYPPPPLYLKYTHFFRGINSKRISSLKIAQKLRISEEYAEAQLRVSPKIFCYHNFRKYFY